MSSNLPTSGRSVFRLIAEIPQLVRELITAEIELFKAEVASKARRAGAGVALIAGAVFAAFLLIGVLLSLAIFALALLMPLWLAAVVVAGILALAVAGLALGGVAILRRNSAWIPNRTIESLTADLEVLRGRGKREHE